MSVSSAIKAMVILYCCVVSCVIHVLRLENGSIIDLIDPKRDFNEGKPDARPTNFAAYFTNNRRHLSILSCI